MLFYDQEGVTADGFENEEKNIFYKIKQGKIQSKGTTLRSIPLKPTT